MTNVRSYTADQLLERVADTAKGFNHYPADYWLLGIRSNEDEYNKFDDKFYLFYGIEFKKVYSGTTNTGANGLKNFETYNKDGVAILEADRIVYGSHRRGISKGRPVYRQDKPFPYYRDNDKDNKSEELGQVINDEIIHAHIHDVKMGNVDADKEFINGWSLACQVFNNGEHWHKFFNVLTKEQEYITYCLLNEFEV